MGSKLVRVIAIVVALAGLALILQSPGFGEAAGQAILASHGGGIDTTLYLARMEAVTANYRIIGAILLGAGLWRAL